MPAVHPSTPASSADRVRIPADVDRPDRILAGLTAHQLALLVPTVLAVAVLYRAASPYLPLPLVAALGIPLLAAGAALALGQRGGLPLDRYVTAALAHRRAPHVHLPAPEGLPAQAGWLPGLDATRRNSPVAARPLAHTVDAAGVVDLGADGLAVIAEVDGVHFTLGTDSDRQAQVTAFARMLNALSGPVQITVRAAPVRLTPHITRIRGQAPALPHPALRAAAVDHAAFLDGLAARRTLLARQILLTAREPLPAGSRGRDAAAGRALRRIADAAGLLATAGLRVRVLDADAVTALLAAAAHPGGPPPPAGVTATGTITTAPSTGGGR
ncbi:PrgI family protein [Frankia sp. CiP3]|uniref:PrgI family protein n=1 Tax=Frankia sp. CiP3 TaxID=2880971 RepID=UPI001EF6D805|nr:PrgI family protein [Frankia sp. CiP3]